LILIGAYFVSVPVWIAGASALVIFLTGILFYLAHSFGHDGSDQMIQIVIGPIGMANQAIEELNALGFSYQLTNGARSGGPR
jgi:hypothetical protein